MNGKAFSHIIREHRIVSLVEIGSVLLWRVFPWPHGRGRYAFKRLIWKMSERFGTLNQYCPIYTDVGWMLLNRAHDILQQQLYMNGTHYEMMVKKFLCARVKQGEVVIDVGAHVGYYTLLLARKVGPKGVVVAFEPQPQLARAIVKSVELNGIRRVIVETKAVSDRNGKVFLFQPKDTGRSSLAGRLTDEDRLLEVETVSLDDYCFSKKLIPSLIKMDIEGAELLALRGMQRLLSNSKNTVNTLLIEVHPNRIASFGGRYKR